MHEQLPVEFSSFFFFFSFFSKSSYRFLEDKVGMQPRPLFLSQSVGDCLIQRLLQQMNFTHTLLTCIIPSTSLGVHKWAELWARVCRISQRLARAQGWNKMMPGNSMVIHLVTLPLSLEMKALFFSSFIWQLKQNRWSLGSWESTFSASSFLW